MSDAYGYNSEFFQRVDKLMEGTDFILSQTLKTSFPILVKFEESANKYHM